MCSSELDVFCLECIRLRVSLWVFRNNSQLLKVTTSKLTSPKNYNPYNPCKKKHIVCIAKVHITRQSKNSQLSAQFLPTSVGKFQVLPKTVHLSCCELWIYTIRASTDTLRMGGTVTIFAKIILIFKTKNLSVFPSVPFPCFTFAMTNACVHLLSLRPRGSSFSIPAGLFFFLIQVFPPQGNTLLILNFAQVWPPWPRAGPDWAFRSYVFFTNQLMLFCRIFGAQPNTHFQAKLCIYLHSF